MVLNIYILYTKFAGINAHGARLYLKRGMFIHIKFSMKKLLSLKIVYVDMTYLNLATNDFQASYINVGYYFTLLVGLQCQYCEFSECGKLTYSQ